ncbi:MAG: caspase family protein, partial [Hyphomicrobiales bacterium]|nr:caspase family protein [Hyphomicrobiales bacterium]
MTMSLAKRVAHFPLRAGLMLAILLAWPLLLAWPAAAQQGQEKRIALVIGNAAYSEAQLPTTANDAGLVAQQLQAAGFDVSGARDLDGDSLRRAFRDFIDKAREAGPDSVAMVYFAGYGLQFEGENYLVPVDAQIPTAADTPIQAVRVSDLTRALAQLPMKARIVVLDAARQNPFAQQGPPLAGGLALVDPDPGFLIAFNAEPGTVAPVEGGGDAYGPYARALAEMIREGGMSLNDLFDQTRLRVSQATNGAVVPWDANRVDASFMFFERSATAPEPPPSAAVSALIDRPLPELGASKAYEAALARDTMPAYQEFLAAYPKDREARRVRAILAARREELVWRRTLEKGTADAYWSYLRRYPRGPHAGECQLWLARLDMAAEPPPDFQPIDYGVPPPPPDEIEVVDRPVLMFGGPDLDLPPPPPVVVLPPPPVYILDLPPPPPPVYDYVLPTPEYAPLPLWVDVPTYVAPPPVNVIYYNIHNTVIVNQSTVVVKDPAGQPVPPLANAVARGALPPGAAFPQTNAAGEMARRGESVQANPVAGLAALHVPPPPSIAARLQANPAANGGPPAVPRRGEAFNPTAGRNGAGAVPPGLTGNALPGQPGPVPLPGQPIPL